MNNSLATCASSFGDVCELDTELPQEGQALIPVREMLSNSMIIFSLLSLF
jgi:hypothetical protein